VEWTGERQQVCRNLEGSAKKSSAAVGHWHQSQLLTAVTIQYTVYQVDCTDEKILKNWNARRASGWRWMVPWPRAPHPPPLCGVRPTWTERSDGQCAPHGTVAQHSRHSL